MALTTDFVAAVRRQGSIPSTVLAADILGLGDDAIQGVFIPLLESFKQNYFVRELTASPDARGRVPIPTRAVGAALRSVQLAMGNGWAPLPLRDIADADYVNGGGLPDAYAVDGGSIILLPNGSTGSLRLRYSARPGKMVVDTTLANAGRITAVVTGGSTTALTCAYAGSGASVDLLSSGPAHQQKALGAALAGATPNWVITNTDLQETPIVGDYLAVADTSPFVPLPEELYGPLVHSVAANLLLSLAYLEEAAAQEKKADKLTAEARPYLLPRNKGNPQTVKGGLLHALRGGARRGRW